MKYTKIFNPIRPVYYISFLFLFSFCFFSCLGPTIPPFVPDSISDLSEIPAKPEEKETATFTFVYEKNKAFVTTAGGKNQIIFLTIMADRTHVWSRIQWSDAHIRIEYNNKAYVIPRHGEYYGYYGVKPRRNIINNQSTREHTWYGALDKGRLPEIGLIFQLSIPVERLAYTYLFLQEYRILGYNIAINTCLHFVVRLSDQLLGEALQVPVNIDQCITWFEKAADGNLKGLLNVHDDVDILKIYLFNNKGIIPKEQETEELKAVAGYTDWKGPAGWKGNNVYHDGFVPPWLKWFF